MNKPTTLNERQFALLQLFLPKVKYKPLKHSYQSILNAILYVMRTGCQWRELPPHFPPWESVYYHYRKLIALGYWEKVLHYTTQLLRIRKQQSRTSSKAIIDSQSVKCTKSCGLRGIDGNKKVKGIKRHRITDMSGLPIITTITKASSGDRKGAREMIGRYKKKLAHLGVKEFYYDQGYSGKDFRNIVAKLTGAIVTVVPRKPKELGFVPLPNRWCIERTNAWCDDYRRLWKATEGLPEINEAVVTISDTFRAVRRLTNGKSRRWAKSN